MDKSHSTHNICFLNFIFSLFICSKQNSNWFWSSPLILKLSEFSSVSSVDSLGIPKYKIMSFAHRESCPLSSQHQSLYSIFLDRWPGQRLKYNATHKWQEPMLCYTFIYCRKDFNLLWLVWWLVFFCSHSFCFLMCVILLGSLFPARSVWILWSYLICGIQLFMVFITLLLFL